MDWYERAMKQIEKELDDGMISEDEFREQMADLDAELQQEAEDAAISAYNDVAGGW